MTDELTRDIDRFTKVQTSHPFRVKCCRCEKMLAVSDKTPPVFADTEGEPFVDYYCEPCKEASTWFRHIRKVQAAREELED